MADENTTTELKGTNLSAVRGELERIRLDNPNHLLMPEAVVHEAADPANPMHGHFTWDDTKAAHERRLDQARQLIRRIKVVFPDDPHENPVPRYVSLTTDRQREGGGYREMNEVMSNTSLLEELELTAKKELAGWLRRHSMLRDLCKRVRDATGIHEPDQQAAGQQPSPGI